MQLSVDRRQRYWFGFRPLKQVIHANSEVLGYAGNPSASWTSTIAIMLEAGILLGAVYMLTRRIWMVWGLHFAWNYVQGSVFGIEVSGTDRQGLFSGAISGPDILSGGSFGVEASLIAVIICLAAGLGILVHLRRTGQFKPSFWSRKRHVQSKLE